MKDAYDIVDEVVKTYREDLERMVEEEERELEEMPDEELLEVIESVLFAQASELDKLIQEFNEKIQRLDANLRNHQHLDEQLVVPLGDSE